MNGQAIIDRARRLCPGVDSVSYPDTQAEEDMNVSYHDIESTIISEIGEDFFWDLWYTDTVIGQTEYTLPTDMYKLTGVSVKPTSTASYQKLTVKYEPELTRDMDSYISTGEKFYYNADNSIFIYPQPTEEITNGIKLRGIRNLADITKTTTEAEMFMGRIPTKFHPMVSLGMREAIYLSQGNENAAMVAKNQFITERSKLVEYLGGRIDTQLVGELPDLSSISN